MHARPPDIRAEDRALQIPIHPQGWPFIAAAVALAAAVFAFIGWPGWLLLPLVVWVVAFFRDPERRAPQGPGLIVSPADGRLLPIVEGEPPGELGLPPGKRRRLSIFMNVFDVHVNRVPGDGAVTALAYRPGKFFNASFDKASEHNERMAVKLRLAGSSQTPLDLVFVQIAGLVARRIVCSLRKDQPVCRGDRFGIIRFGSRVDLYLPESARILVKEGQTVRGGETVLADYPA
jgi:phosphatidylserine decarboxylase